VGLPPTAVFKTAALVHSAIPPGIEGETLPSLAILPYPSDARNNLISIFQFNTQHLPVQPAVKDRFIDYISNQQTISI
jgi:hypothetical protein